MSCINFNEISSLITKWLQNSSIESLQFTDSKLVEKQLVLYFIPIKIMKILYFTTMCFELLNAVIKTEAFKNKLSNDLIKSNAARLIKTVDVLKTMKSHTIIVKRNIVYISSLEVLYLVFIMYH